VLAIADTRQVSDYWDRYNQVLVTNYREFLLIGRDDRGNPVRHEYYRLAANEREFWQLEAEPNRGADVSRRTVIAADAVLCLPH
jgi:hypothetical protein